MRVKAAELLKRLDPTVETADAIRPAPVAGAAELRRSALIAPAVSPHVYIETEKGTIEIELDVLDAPITASNFMTLARKGYFDGLSFHRVVPNFVVQGGDPRGDGEGGPGYTIRDELNQEPVSARHGRYGARVARHRRQPVLHHARPAAAPGRALHRLRPSRGRNGRRRSTQQWDVIQRVRVWDGIKLTLEDP